MSSSKCVGWSKRLAKRLHHAARSLWTAAVRCMCRPVVLVRACLTCVKMPLAPSTSGVIIRSIPRSLYHFCRDMLWAEGVISSSATCTLTFRFWGRRSNCATVSMFHPNMVLYIDYVVSPFHGFFFVDGLLTICVCLFGRA